jgi:hypothetical protein
MALEAYLNLFAVTGEQQWLQAAEVAAQICETWIILWDISMPLDDRTGRFYGDVSTIGLQLITTAQHPARLSCPSGHGCASSGPGHGGDPQHRKINAVAPVFSTQKP